MYIEDSQLQLSNSRNMSHDEGNEPLGKMEIWKRFLNIVGYLFIRYALPKTIMMDMIQMMDELWTKAQIIFLNV